MSSRGRRPPPPGLPGEGDPTLQARTRANLVIADVLNTLSLEAQDAVVSDETGARRSMILVALGLGTTTAALLIWRRRALSAVGRSERASSTIRQMATQTNRAVRRASAMANYDTLTGLPSRERFVRLLEVALVEARRAGTAVAVLVVDVSRFQLVNDALGHASGDRLLTAVAKRLRAGLDEHHYLARLGGDEFLVLLGGLDRRDAQAGQGATEIAQGLLESMREPVRARRRGALDRRQHRLQHVPGPRRQRGGSDPPGGLGALPREAARQQLDRALRPLLGEPGGRPPAARVRAAARDRARRVPAVPTCRRWRCRRSRSAAWRRCCAGITRSAAWSCPPSSCRCWRLWARSCRSGAGRSAGPARTRRAGPWPGCRRCTSASTSPRTSSWTPSCCRCCARPSRRRASTRRASSSRSRRRSR